MEEIQGRLIEEMGSILEEAIGTSIESLEPPEGVALDLVLRCGEYLFLVEARRSGSAAPVYMAAKSLRRAERELLERLPTASSAAIVPVLVVPYMGEAGRRVCEEEGLAWLDRSGNASIRAPGLRILMRGHENRFKKRGRKATPFAPQASRIARQFLLDDNRSYTQKQLVEATGLDQGFVSRVLRRMEEDHLLARRARQYEVTDRTLLLSSWQEVYDFTKHRVIKGHIAARSSEDLTAVLSTAFQNEGLTSAATGLAGAWLLTRFASFRLVTFYLNHEPPREVLAQLGFRDQERGANTWIVIPNDKGVFFGRQERDGIWSAHPVQVYLD